MRRRPSFGRCAKSQNGFVLILVVANPGALIMGAI